MGTHTTSWGALPVHLDDFFQNPTFGMETNQQESPGPDRLFEAVKLDEQPEPLSHLVLLVHLRFGLKAEQY